MHLLELARHAPAVSLDVQRDQALERRCSRVGVLWGSPVIRYLLRLSPASRETQLKALVTCARAYGAELGAIDWPTVDNAQVGALRAFLADRYAPRTANRIIGAVRGVLRQCTRDELMSREAYERAIDVPVVRGDRVPRGRSAEPAELAALVTNARAELEKSPIGARNAAMVAMLWGAGLRRAEVASLKLGDFNDATGDLRVKGKGNKERVVPLPPRCAELVREWIALRSRIDGPLICLVWRNRIGWGVDPRRSLTPTRVYVIVRRLARRARIAHLSPHDLRRTYCGDLLDAGADLSVVQALMGHADPATTARYDRRGERSRRAAVSKLSEPF